MTPARKKALLKKAALHLNLKFKLEHELSSKMRHFLSEQNAQFLAMWEAHKLKLDAGQNRTQLERILTDHYRKAGKTFSRMTVEDAEDAIASAHPKRPEDINENHPELLGLLLLLAMRKSKESAEEITAGSNADIDRAMETSGGDGRLAAATLQGRVLPRSQSIAVTETQRAVEASKNTTAVFIASTVPALAESVIDTTKVWMTQMDQKVRPAHANALFQERKLKEPFEVGGQLLMYPGDTSLGASLWNVVHCRCSSIYEY